MSPDEGANSICTYVHIVENGAEHFQPIFHALEFDVHVDELGLVLPPLIAGGRGQSLDFTCKERYCPV